MYYHAKIIPDPPDGVAIVLHNSTIIINPNNIRIIENELEKGKLVYVAITNIEKLQKIEHLAETTRIIAPPITTNPQILVYPEQKPAIIDKHTTLYYINPPTTQNQINYYIYLKTQQLEILYASRPTHIRKPPHVDIIITTQKTLEQIQKTAKPNEIPNYLGADPQLIIIIANRNHKQEPYIYTKNKTIIITRHLTQILAKIEE